MRVAQPLPVLADARLEAEGVELLLLDLVGLRREPGRQCAESAAILARAVAQVVIPPGACAEECRVAQIILVDELHRVAADAHAVVEAGSSVGIAVPIHRIRALGQRHAARLAVRFIVGVDNQIGARRGLLAVAQRAAPGIDVELAVGLAEAVRLTVVVVAVITELPDGPADFGKVRVVVEAADGVERTDAEGRVGRRFFHDVVHRAAGLRSVEQGRTAAQQLDAIHRIDRRGVIGLGVTDHVGMDRDAIFQHLHELHAVRIESAGADADQRR